MSNEEHPYGTLDIPVEGANASQDGEAEAPEVETEDQVEDETPESEEESPPSDEKPVEKPKGVQKRLDELTRNWREAERREQQLLDMLAAQKGAEKPPETEVTKSLADFDYDEDAYRAYTLNTATDAARAAAREEARRWQSKQVAEARAEVFKAREAEFAATQTDYDKVAHNPDLKISNEMAQIIRESDDGPAVAYHLGKNPSLAEKLSAMSPLQAAREMGRIEATIAADRKAAVRAVSKAPPPTPKLEGASAQVDRDPDKMSTKDWLKWREKQLAKKAK